MVLMCRRVVPQSGAVRVGPHWFCCVDCATYYEREKGRGEEWTGFADANGAKYLDAVNAYVDAKSKGETPKRPERLPVTPWGVLDMPAHPFPTMDAVDEAYRRARRRWAECFMPDEGWVQTAEAAEMSERVELAHAILTRYYSE